MKKLALILLCLCVLTGCSDAGTFETLGNVDHVSATLPDVRNVVVKLPGDAAVLTASGGDTMYICEEYSIALQTLSAGDLRATVDAISGYSPEQLTVMESVCGDHERYDWVWTAAGEGGDVVCRAAVLDDGNYHYAITVMADAATAGELTQEWNELFSSFCLEA